MANGLTFEILNIILRIFYPWARVWPYPEKDRKRLETPKKTRKRLYFNQIMFICYYNPILYISMCSKHVFASLFYVNDRNTVYSSLVCSVPVFLSFGTNAPPGELNVISLLGLSANKIHEYMLVQVWASVVDGVTTLNQQWVNVSCLLGYL